jgi:exonuclease SbcC
LTKAHQSRPTLQIEIDKFNAIAIAVGVVIEPSAENAEELLQSKSSPIRNEIDELKSQIKTITEKLETARSNAANAKNALTSKLADEAAKKDAVKRSNQNIDTIRKDDRWSRLSMEIPQEKVAADEKVVLQQLNPLNNEFTNAQSELAKKNSEVIALRKESTLLKTQLQALRSQISNLHRTTTQVATKLNEANLPNDSTEESLLSLITQETRQQEVLIGLRDSTTNLELALDVVTTAAALSTLQQNIRNKEKTVDQAKKRRDSHKPWLIYFNSIARLLSSQQNEAIANFTNDYGPRTSVIQRRLRSVYGFDDIEIHSHESNIQVRVKRHGEELRPTDYFSQSQQQTLLLGLFLTACISQTWSGFSAVFMDDPVTHFDDLNTYAFLDLIVGLLESDTGKRQFIISTCDEKLLQLAQQKFRHLGERATFYRFEAIGLDGPVVAQPNLY